MTDTARTVAELKALLADNTSQAISAQDMRDVVESVANPVIAGGLDRPIRWAGRSAVTGSATFYDLTNTPIQYDPTYQHDPEGWFTDEPEFSTAYTDKPVLQGGLLRLPPGWYDAFIYQAWAGDPLASGADVHAGLQYADDFTGLVDPNVFWYYPFVGLVAVPPPNAGLKNVFSYATLLVPSVDLVGNPVTTFPVCAFFNINHQGTDVTQSAGSLLLRRMGDA